MSLDMLHLVARISVERMVYSLLEGTALAVFMALLLRVLPRRNARTRFIIWFSVLVLMLALPFAGHSWKGVPASAIANGQPGAGVALLTLPGAWALYLFTGWAFIAGISMARVMAGLWQVYKLRRESAVVPLDSLPVEARDVVENFRRLRKVTVCRSERVQIPTAIGFLNPAVILPQGFVEEVSASELKQVLLHELTHLRRRDDWTNLAQKMVKALLFFHPSVWWIEQRLSLEREMACDDAVLAHTASPRAYATCLTRMAERSFMRRQVRLAQAAVDRMRQLSLRVSQILDTRRPGTSRLWKPAIPLVAAAGLVCVFSAGHAPEIVSFADPVRVVSSNAVPTASATRASVVPVVQPAVAKPKAQPRLILAKSSESRRSNPQPQVALAETKACETGEQMPHALASRHAKAAQPRMVNASYNLAQDGYVVREQSLVLVNDSGQAVWQVRMWEVQLKPPAGKSLPNPNSRKST